MKLKNMKRITIGLLIGAALHNASFAGAAMMSHRLEPAAPGMSGKKSLPRVPRPATATPCESGSQPPASEKFNAGENSFSVGGDNWFRD
jgi:hypothetical protein